MTNGRAARGPISMALANAEYGDPKLLGILNRTLDRHGISRTFATHDERPTVDGHPDYFSDLPAFDVAVFRRPESEPIVWTTLALFKRDKGSTASAVLARIQASVDQGPWPEAETLAFAAAPKVIGTATAAFKNGENTQPWPHGSAFAKCRYSERLKKKVSCFIPPSMFTAPPPPPPHAGWRSPLAVR